MPRAAKVLIWGLFATALLGVSACDPGGNGADPCSIPNPDMQTQQACAEQQNGGDADWWHQGYPSYGYGTYG